MRGLPGCSTSMPDAAYALAAGASLGEGDGPAKVRPGQELQRQGLGQDACRTPSHGCPPDLVTLGSPLTCAELPPLVLERRGNSRAPSATDPADLPPAGAELLRGVQRYSFQTVPTASGRQGRVEERSPSSITPRRSQVRRGSTNLLLPRELRRPVRRPRRRPRGSQFGASGVRASPLGRRCGLRPHLVLEVGARKAKHQGAATVSTAARAHRGASSRAADRSGPRAPAARPDMPLPSPGRSGTNYVD